RVVHPFQGLRLGRRYGDQGSERNKKQVTHCTLPCVPAPAKACSTHEPGRHGVLIKRNSRAWLKRLISLRARLQQQIRTSLIRGMSEPVCLERLREAISG